MNSVFELALVSASVAPPEDTPTVSLTAFELSFIDIGILARPLVESSTFLLISLELTNIIVATVEIELPSALNMPIMEAPIYHLLTTLIIGDPSTMGPLRLGLPNIDHIHILQQIGLRKHRLHMQHQRRRALHNQQLPDPILNLLELGPDKLLLIVEIVEVVLHLLEVLLLALLVDLEVGAHAADQQVEGLVEVFD